MSASETKSRRPGRDGGEGESDTAPARDGVGVVRTALAAACVGAGAVAVPGAPHETAEQPKATGQLTAAARSRKLGRREYARADCCEANGWLMPCRCLKKRSPNWLRREEYHFVRSVWGPAALGIQYATLTAGCLDVRGVARVPSMVQPRIRDGLRWYTEHAPRRCTTRVA